MKKKIKNTPYTVLIARAKQEQHDFKKELLSLTQSEILDRAQEYSLRNEIFVSLDTLSLTDEQIQALLNQPEIMRTLYDEVMSEPSWQMTWIDDAICVKANQLIAESEQAEQTDDTEQTAETEQSM